MANPKSEKLKTEELKPEKQESEKPEIAHPWDFWMKTLSKQEAQTLVSFLLPGAEFKGARDKELQARTIKADLLFDHVFYFRNLKLWEISPAVFKQVGFEGLLPLLPLTQGGNSRVVVEEMFAELEARDRKDLLTFGWAFAALVFDKSDDDM